MKLNEALYRAFAIAILGFLLYGCAVQVRSIDSRLSPGQEVDDRLLASSIEKAIRSEFRKRRAPYQILPVTLDGRVFLIGSVTQPFHQDVVGEIISDFRHVKSVHNELKIGPLRTRAQANTDRRIGAAARLALVNDPLTRAEDIRLYTHKGTVYIVGIVTRATSQAAADLIKIIRGVNGVVLLVDYLD